MPCNTLHCVTYRHWPTSRSPSIMQPFHSEMHFAKSFWLNWLITATRELYCIGNSTLARSKSLKVSKWPNSEDDEYCKQNSNYSLVANAGQPLAFWLTRFDLDVLNQKFWIRCFDSEVPSVWNSRCRHSERKLFNQVNNDRSFHPHKGKAKERTDLTGTFGMLFWWRFSIQTLHPTNRNFPFRCWISKCSFSNSFFELSIKTFHSSKDAKASNGGPP